MTIAQLGNTGEPQHAHLWCLRIILPRACRQLVTSCSCLRVSRGLLTSQERCSCRTQVACATELHCVRLHLLLLLLRSHVRRQGDHALRFKLLCLRLRLLPLLLLLLLLCRWRRRCFCGLMLLHCQRVSCWVRLRRLWGDGHLLISWRLFRLLCASCWLARCYASLCCWRSLLCCQPS